MATLTAYIEGIGLLGPGLADWTVGREILAGRKAYQPQKTVIPPPALLPPAERRRCGEFVKLALATSTEAMAAAEVEASNLPSVFTASHGDGHNCHTICEMLASDDRQISPTRFHNSVHNAASGYWSIATGAMAPSAVLCAFDASFGAGLLEAMTQVAVDGTRCILIASDTDYPEPVYSVRPLSELLGISLVLAPEPTPRVVARISVTFSGEPADRFTDEGLENLRLTIPAARGLPLLRAIAAGATGRVVLDYLEETRITVEVSSC
ncbi:MAG: beta-ketoacyl synthase chain length factor [Methylophilaceae bacterium]